MVSLSLVIISVGNGWLLVLRRIVVSDALKGSIIRVFGGYSDSSVLPILVHRRNLGNHFTTSSISDHLSHPTFMFL